MIKVFGCFQVALHVELNPRFEIDIFLFEIFNFFLTEVMQKEVTY